jgi:hypothetical protein
MRFLLIAFVAGVFTLSAGTSHQPRGWNGLVPLHSTRADVERILGPSGDPCNCLYKTANESVHVEYADGACRGVPPGWNVPAGTVLVITIRSIQEIKISDLNIDASRYVRFNDDAGTIYLASRDDGIKYEFSRDGTMTGISYIPSIRDHNLRCSGFPPADATTAHYKNFDEYLKRAVTNENARLDNFAVELLNNKDFMGYVIGYAGRSARVGETRTNLNEIRSYLIKKRSVPPNRVVMINGGHRENATIEFYLVPRKLPAPVPTPTISTAEVQIIK